MLLKGNLLIATFVCAVVCNAQTCLPDVNFWGDFSGKLGDREIALSIYRISGDVLSGNYRYTDNEQKPITVKGSIKDCIYFLEVTGDKKEAGKFMFRYSFDKTKKEDHWDGRFTDADNKERTVTLRLSSMVGGTLTQRYDELFGTTQEVDSFAAKIRTAVINNDKNWLAEHCSYPLNFHAGSSKAVDIKNKAAFLANYNKYFTPAYRDKLKKANCYNMFSNHMGASMGNGAIWINHTLTSTADEYEYCISSINIF